MSTDKKPIARPTMKGDVLNTLLFTELTPAIAKALADNVNTICMQNKFTIDGYDLTWKRLGRKAVKRLDDLLADNNVEYPEGMEDKEERARWIQREYLKLSFDGFTDETYEEMDLGAIEVLIRAPIVRQRGLFRQDKS